uniref:Uncharacterized protein n=1 Tax=Panagrolaimus sp. ES5 TaxID=591445 RepID=A0AC34G6L0_9BILA
MKYKSKKKTAAAKKLSGFAESIDLKAKKESSSWKKSNKHLSPNFLHRNKESDEKHEFKKSKNSNNSTLSLHIAAYEDSVDADSDDSNAGETEVLKNINERKALIDSSSFFKNSFEFPRQQGEDGNKHPEVMQFKASQRLRNPNEDNKEISSVERKSVYRQQQSDYREIGSGNYFIF